MLNSNTLKNKGMAILIRKLIPGVIRALLLIILLVLDSILIPASLYLACFIRLFLPFKSWRKVCTGYINFIPRKWSSIFFNTTQWLNQIDIRIHFDGRIDKRKSYIALANHQSWADIFVVHKFCNFRTPMVRFFLKRELIKIPFIGWACWLLNYPFMYRHTKESIRKNPELRNIDKQNTRKFCERYKDMPVTIINFSEGTRFTKEKHQRQSSPYHNLLKPKVGGLAHVLDAMNGQVSDILNLTIHYHNNRGLFWDVLSGKTKRIDIHAEILPITEELRGDYENDKEFRTSLQSWMNTVWEEKDQLLEKYNHE